MVSYSTLWRERTCRRWKSSRDGNSWCSRLRSALPSTNARAIPTWPLSAAMCGAQPISMTQAWPNLCQLQLGATKHFPNDPWDPRCRLQVALVSNLLLLHLGHLRPLQQTHGLNTSTSSCMVQWYHGCVGDGLWDACSKLSSALELLYLAAANYHLFTCLGVRWPKLQQHQWNFDAFRCKDLIVSNCLRSIF